MPKILDQLPYVSQDDLTFVRQEQVRVKAYEILIWVSLQMKQDHEWQSYRQPFPALLDTAHTHNFSIREDHLERWSGLRLDRNSSLGNIRHLGRLIPLYPVNVWMHRNVRGQRDQLLKQTPHRLELQRGIALYPKEGNFPRLPLLGLRALTKSRLHLAIDGEHSRISLRSPDWLTRLVQFFS